MAIHSALPMAPMLATPHVHLPIRRGDQGTVVPWHLQHGPPRLQARYRLESARGRLLNDGLVALHNLQCHHRIDANLLHRKNAAALSKYARRHQVFLGPSPMAHRRLANRANLRVEPTLHIPLHIGNRLL